jgi:hypothetical protein
MKLTCGLVVSSSIYPLRDLCVLGVSPVNPGRAEFTRDTAWLSGPQSNEARRAGS